MDERVENSGPCEVGPDESDEIEIKAGYYSLYDERTWRVVPGCYQKMQCPAMS